MTLRHRLLTARLRLFARYIGASKRPVLIGPWRSELGFESLYWLPFLAALRKQYHWDRARLVAMGRGGTAALYDTAGRAELYEHVSIDLVRLRTLQAQQRQASTKQFAIEDWERHASGLAAASLGISKPILFHPSWMYQLLAPAWRDQMPMETLAHWLAPTAIPELPLPEGLVLPERFIAVRLYARATFTPHEPTMLYLKRRLAALAVKQPLVFLCTDERYDDHADLLRPYGPNMVDVSKWLTTRTNLAVQLAVLQRARLFVGTYGGLAQTAMRFGVPTVALYTQWGGTAFCHLDVSHRLALASKTAFHMVDAGSLEAMDALW